MLFQTLFAKISSMMPIDLKLNFLKTKDIEMITPLQGGSTCKTFLIETKNKKKYCCKTLEHPPKDFFVSEQQGLALIESTETFKTPTVIECGDNYLLMDYIETVTPTLKHWKQCAKNLALLHDNTTPQYGLDYDNFLAALSQKNQWQSNWITFFSEQRLKPLLNHPSLTEQDRESFFRLMECFKNHLDPHPKPSLIHGDLWQHNVLFAKNDIYVIDPAVYYAPREMELAYWEWIAPPDCPLFDLYQSEFPLPNTYHEQRVIYRLYPVLFHLHLVGDVYLAEIRSILNFFE